MSDLIAKTLDKGRYWVIKYKYPNSKTWGEYTGLEKEFYLEIFANGNRISGNTIEENYFENNANSEVTGNISGTIVAEEIKFIRIYNSKHLNHSVEYQGHVDLQLGQIKGVWNIQGPDISNLPGGSFEMSIDEGDAFVSLIQT